MGLVPGPHALTNRTRDTGDAEPWLPAPEDGRPGEGQRLTPGAPHNGSRPPPPGTAPHHPRGMQPPQGMQAKGTVLGPHTHTAAPTARGWRTPTARPVGGQSGEGRRLTPDAPHNGGKHPPPWTPFRHPHSEQRQPARAHAVGPVLGPHARTDRTRDTRDAEPWLPAPEDGRPGEGQRLTPGVGFTRIGEEERRDGEAIALHKTHIWANSLKPVCFLCFLLFWCPLLPFIETGTLKIYTKMVLYMKNEIFDLKYPLHGV